MSRRAVAPRAFPVVARLRRVLRGRVPTLSALVLCALAPLTAADHDGDTIPVPQAVATALDAAAAAPDPAAALAELERYRGPPHALIDLALAQNLALLADAADASASATATAPVAASSASVTAPAASVRRLGALMAYRDALALDPTLSAAHLGLAQLDARAGDWRGARAELAPAVDADRATAQELLFYGQAAAMTGDWTLATVIAERGLLRFPGEPGFRRQRLDALLRAGEILPARADALALLATHPDDAALWTTIAWCAHQSADGPGERAALEAAWLAHAHDRADGLRLAHAQLDAQEPQAALATLDATQAAAPAAAAPASADPALATLAITAALAAHDVPAAERWLALLPPAARDRRQRLLATEVALQSGDAQAAATAAAALIALGEDDPAVLAWTGALAERAGDDPHAEAWYRQALAASASATSTDANAEPPAAHTAAVRLAALLIRESRRDEAAVLLATVLARHPDDQAARQLLDLAQAR
jgi:hypothetical protein